MVALDGNHFQANRIRSMTMTVANFSLSGEVALVTGGSKGIGRAIALAFAEQGADLVISARNQEDLDNTKKDIEALGRRCLAVSADLSKDEDIVKLHTAACEAFGVIDILVNNAGCGEFAGLHDLTREGFDFVMQVNTWAPIYLAQLCFPAWRERGEGRIINIGSNGGLKPDPFMGAYTASKAGVIKITQQMAQEWSKYGVRANVINPGLVKTEMASDLTAHLEMLGNTHNIARRGADPSELAGIAVLLASPAGSYCQGEMFNVDGGELYRPTYDFSIEQYTELKQSMGR